MQADGENIYYCRAQDLHSPSQDSAQDTVCSRFTVTRGEGKSSFAQCVFNLSNKLMGVGLLGLPYALKLAGWFGGLTAFIGLAFITWKTSIFIGRELNGSPQPLHKTGSLLKERMHDPIRTFPDIAKCAFGDTGFFLLSVVFYFELYSTICILFVTIGDHLDPLFPSVSAEGLTALSGVLSLIPTLTLTSPARMSYLSAVGTCCTLAIVSTVVVSAAFAGDMSEQIAEENNMDDALPYHQAFDGSGLMFSLGLVAYCFSGHAIVPSIYTSMEHPEQFERMVSVTYIVVTSTCVAVAVSGYYMFGSTVLDQITLSLEQSPWAMQVMDCLTVLLVLTSFSKVTLTLFPIATSIEDLVEPFLPSYGENNEEITSALIKFSLTVLALLVSVFVPSFSYLVALVGMICTMTVSVIFPSAAYLQLFGSKLGTGAKFLNVVFILTGFIVAIVGTIDRTTGFFDVETQVD